MAEKKIDPTEAGGKRFRIKKAAHLRENFPDHQEVEVLLSEGSEQELDVFQKDIPAVLKGIQYKNKAVHWLNNFGMKKKGSSRFEDAVPDYGVILERVEGAEYVYYDGPVDRFDEAGLHPLTAEPVKGSSKKVQVRLRRGDPAVGWVK